MRGKTVMAAAFAVVALTSCRDSGEGDAFALDGKIFVFNHRVATATYLVNIKQLRPLGEGHVAVASFQDPAGGPDILVREKIWPNSTKTTINSPPLHCIVKDKPYRIAVRIEDAAGKAVQQIETTLASGQDQTDLPDKPLVVGPFYTPNPGDVEAPGNKPDRCPA